MTQIPTPLTAAIIKARMLAIQQQAKSFTDLTSSGYLLRHGTTWYVDTIYNATELGDIAETVTSLNMPPPANLLAQLINLKNSIAELNSSRDRNYTNLLLRLEKLEAAIVDINAS